MLAALAGSLWPAEINPKRYLEDVKYLSSEQLKGRGTGTPELEMAARYLAREFGKAGLKPIAGGDYFQAFRVTTNARLGQKNRIEVIESGRRHALDPGQDFQPFNFSATGTVSAGLVFAGYGITAREYGYDDYQGLDAKGKFVLDPAARTAGARREERLRRPGPHRARAVRQQGLQRQDARRRRRHSGERPGGSLGRRGRVREVRAPGGPQ